MTIKEAFKKYGSGVEIFYDGVWWYVASVSMETRNVFLLEQVRGSCTRLVHGVSDCSLRLAEKRKVWQWRYRSKDNKNWVVSSRLYHSEKDLKEAKECYDPDNDCIYEKLPWTEMEE